MEITEDLETHGAGSPGDASLGTLTDAHRDPDPPEAVLAAADKEREEPLSDSEVVDATEWLLADEVEQEEETTPTTVKIEVAEGRVVEWRLRPLSGPEFKMARKWAMGSNRETTRKLAKGDIADLMDEQKYQLFIVSLATVSPDLEKAAKTKGVHPTEVVSHRFRYKPGWIAELAGIVNDISGYDTSKIEVVATSATGNS